MPNGLEAAKEEEKFLDANGGSNGAAVGDKEGSVRFKCPGFKGEEKEYEDWRMKIEGWLYLTRKSVECQGLVIVQGLEGKALSVVRGLNIDVLKGKDGATKVLSKLDEFYKKERIFEINDRIAAFAAAERRKGESVKEFILRFEYLSDECEKLGVSLLASGEAKGGFLLQKARISEDEKKMVLSACGLKSMDYSLVRPVLKRLFEDKDNDTEKDDGWYGRSSDRGRQSSDREYGRDYVEQNFRRDGKNPMRNGVVSRCVICSSEYHWARNCPKNVVNRGRRGASSATRAETSGTRQEIERVKTSNENADRIYMASGDDKEYWEDLEAILDSGCKSSVIGDI